MAMTPPFTLRVATTPQDEPPAATPQTEPAGQTNFDQMFRSLATAAVGEGGPDAQRIALTAISWASTLLAKNHDYGGSVWKPPVLSPGIDAREAIFVRMSDKVERIRSLRAGNHPQVAESLADTIGDLGSYCLLLLASPATLESPHPDHNQES